MQLRRNDHFGRPRRAAEAAFLPGNPELFMQVKHLQLAVGGALPASRSGVSSD